MSTTRTSRRRLPVGMPEAEVHPSAERPALRVDGDALADVTDQLAVEEPLEIRVEGAPVAVTMRTPGHDEDLAVGFLVTEAVLISVGDIAAIARAVDETGRTLPNVIDVRVRPGASANVERGKRVFYAASSCGICGKATIDALRVRVSPLVPSGPSFTLAMLRTFPGKMRSEQPTWDATAGLHAAALFDREGRLVLLREDVGRHNATDAVIGAAARAGLAVTDHALLVSGRAGFEIVQKAAVAGIGVVLAISAPSSLAVDLAVELGVTLVGFLRPPRATVYAHAERLIGLR